MAEEKILKDEVLSEEELDKVSGGTIEQAVKDTQFLHALGILDREYTASEIQSNPKAVESAIHWAMNDTKQGLWLEFELDLNGNNRYRNRAWENPNCPRDVMLKMIAEAEGKPDFDVSKYL